MNPCQVSRRGGATHAARDVLKGFSTNFTEPKAVDWRLKSFAIKIEQVDQSKADVLVSACFSCRLSLDGGKAAWG